MILEVARVLLLTDFFVIATGENRIQLRAIADDIGHQLKAAGLHSLSIVGYKDGRWILMDYRDVVVHLFLPEAREYYDLELLWGDAPRLDWQPSEAPPGRTSR